MGTTHRAMLGRTGDEVDFRRVTTAADTVRIYRNSTMTSSRGLLAIGWGAWLVRLAERPGFQRLNPRGRPQLRELRSADHHAKLAGALGHAVVNAATSSQKDEQEPVQAEEPLPPSVGSASSSYSGPTMGSADSELEAFEGGRRIVDNALHPASQVLQLRETTLRGSVQAAAKEALQDGIEERRDESFRKGTEAQ
ncbi:uncharacterized protein LOC144119660 [Amblyomma americanum]